MACDRLRRSSALVLIVLIAFPIILAYEQNGVAYAEQNGTPIWSVSFGKSQAEFNSVTVISCNALSTVT